MSTFQHQLQVINFFYFFIFNAQLRHFNAKSKNQKRNDFTESPPSLKIHINDISSKNPPYLSSIVSFIKLSCPWDVSMLTFQHAIQKSKMSHQKRYIKNQKCKTFTEWPPVQGHIHVKRSSPPLFLLQIKLKSWDLICEVSRSHTCVVWGVSTFRNPHTALKVGFLSVFHIFWVCSSHNFPPNWARQLKLVMKI